MQTLEREGAVEERFLEMRRDLKGTLQRLQRCRQVGVAILCRDPYAAVGATPVARLGPRE